MSRDSVEITEKTRQRLEVIKSVEPNKTFKKILEDSADVYASKLCDNMNGVGFFALRNPQEYGLTLSQLVDLKEALYHLISVCYKLNLTDYANEFDDVQHWLSVEINRKDWNDKNAETQKLEKKLM